MTTTEMNMTGTGAAPAGWRVEFAQGGDLGPGPWRAGEVFDLLRAGRGDGSVGAPERATGGGGRPGGCGRPGGGPPWRRTPDPPAPPASIPPPLIPLPLIPPPPIPPPLIPALVAGERRWAALPAGPGDG